MGPFPLGIDESLAATEELPILKFFESAFGSPDEALDFYQAAGIEMKRLMDASEVTQGDIDAYNELSGDGGDVHRYADRDQRGRG
jgi:hypothetical protein